MAIPNYSMRDLLQAGIHFGHHPRRWNPKMTPFLYGIRNKVHIINLEKTFPLLKRALKAIETTVESGGRVLFVGTKRQASDILAREAKRCSQYYVNHRWLGGMLTNWKTISKSIVRMKAMRKELEDPEALMTKKERLNLTRKLEKLESSIGGIEEMGGLPDIIFILDTNKESIAVEEARQLGIPIVAVLDSNSNPDHIAYPIPGNDDAIRSIEFYCHLISSSVLSGLEKQMAKAGVDLGASETLPEEPTFEEKKPEEAQKS